MSRNYSETIEELIAGIEAVEDAAAADRIEAAAADLERTHYEPLFLLPVAGFLRMTASDILQYARRVVGMTESEIAGYHIRHMSSAEEVKEKQLRMLLRNYALLARLRADEPEAWDEVHELYEDD
jgi:hypothetical protein